MADRSGCIMTFGKSHGIPGKRQNFNFFSPGNRKNPRSGVFLIFTGSTFLKRYSRKNWKMFLIFGTARTRRGWSHLMVVPAGGNLDR